MQRMSLFVLMSLLILSFGIYFFTISHKQQQTSAIPTPTLSSTENTQIPNYISVGAVPDIPFKLPSGFTIHVFASGLGHPRDLQFSPGETLLVSNPESNEVIALPDTNHDGVADTQKVIISDISHAHGLAFYQGNVFVAGVNEVVRYKWNESNLQATQAKTLFSLPNNNDHNNRTIIFNQQGQLFVSLGSTCNVCRESPEQGGSILVSDANGDNLHVFAKGLRNAPFLAIHPKTGDLWATEMGRDYLGDNVPPDEMDSITEGKDYGWPNCYGNKIHDTQFDKNQYFRDPCSDTVAPIFEIPAHSAPLGLAFISSTQFPSDWQGDLLVAYHGSWNRSTPTGYKVVHMKVQGNSITSADDFLTGFLENGKTLSRPVDVIFDNQGNLYISDDKSGNIYIVQKASLSP